MSFPLFSGCLQLAQAPAAKTGALKEGTKASVSEAEIEAQLARLKM